MGSVYELFPEGFDVSAQWHCGECHEAMVSQAVGMACLNLSCDQYGKILSTKGTTMNRLTLNDMADAAYSNSVTKGFWDNTPKGTLRVETILAKLALIHSEVSEATEDARDGKLKTRRIPDGPKAGKPEGFGSELADILIRVGDLAKRMGIDLEDEVTLKMVYNSTRPRMHGKAA